MIPIVTVCPMPSGLPTARTTSPTWTASELPTATRRKIGRINFQEREIARLVGADQLRLEAAAVGKLDADVVGRVDHVVVGQDVAVTSDDHAGSQPALLECARRPLAALTLPRTELIAEKPAQHVFVVAELCRPDLRASFDPDGHHAGATIFTTSAYESRPPAIARRRSGAP